MNLTIAIPSYNRPEKIRRTVEALLRQVTPEVKIIILDNASDTPVSVALAAISSPALEIIKNSHNVGANANILRCFEVAESEWVWVLGDDDLPEVDAIETALAEISASPDSLCINFNSAHGPSEQNFSTIGRLQFLQQFPTFGNMLFISTNLYRVEPLREHLHLGYRYAYSMAPHLSMLLTALGEEGKVVFKNEKLVAWEPPNDAAHWSAINHSLSIPTILELPLSPEERRVFARKLQLLDVPNLLIQLLGTGVKRGEFETSRFYLHAIRSRIAPFNSFKNKVEFCIAAAMLRFPQIGVPLMDKVTQKMKGTSMLSRLRRDVDDPHG